VLGLGAPTFELDAIDIMQNGKIIQGCIEGDSDPLTMVPELLRLHGTGKLGLGGLITTYPFHDINVRHEALCVRMGVRDPHRLVVAAAGLKLRAA